MHTVQAPARFLLVCQTLVSWTSMQCLLQASDRASASCHLQQRKSQNCFPLQELAQQCMLPDDRKRPTFREICDELEPMRDAVYAGQLRAQPIASAKPEEG